MDAIIQWAKAQSPLRWLAYYVGMAWLSGAYVYRSPVWPDAVEAEVYFAIVGWPVYWFARTATIGF